MEQLLKGVKVVKRGERVEKDKDHATPVGNWGTLQPGARSFRQHRYAISAERWDIGAMSVRRPACTPRSANLLKKKD